MPHYLILGGSRNIGLHVVTLLTSTTNATCTLLLRSPDSFIASNPTLAPPIKKGQIRIVKGDATMIADIARAWHEVSKVDCIVFSIGGTPQGISLTKGFKIDRFDICSSAIIALLRHLRSLNIAPDVQPRLIVISSMGITMNDYARLPWFWKPFYSWGLQIPGADKLGMEYFLHHCAGLPLPSNEPLPKMVTQKEEAEKLLPPSVTLGGCWT